ncbi:hypothetical protein ACUHMQ_06645 [Chitinimonas sp. PSY-7]|uniref:hypothetical protein n=1 Tax=Chitinimonas sp. PSY-7 TaxID=3459088 RepID=UPI0040403554
MSGMHVDLKPGESVLIGETRLVVEEKRGQRTRIAIVAPPTVRIIKIPPSNTGNNP